MLTALHPFYFLPFYFCCKGKRWGSLWNIGKLSFLLHERTLKSVMSKMMWRKVCSHILIGQWKPFYLITWASLNLFTLLIQICAIFKIDTMQNIKKQGLNSCPEFNPSFKPIYTAILELQILAIHWFIHIINSIHIMHFLLMPSIFYANK